MRVKSRWTGIPVALTIAAACFGCNAGPDVDVDIPQDLNKPLAERTSCTMNADCPELQVCKERGANWYCYTHFCQTDDDCREKDWMKDDGVADGVGTYMECVFSGVANICVDAYDDPRHCGTPYNFVCGNQCEDCESDAGATEPCEVCCKAECIHCWTCAQESGSKCDDSPYKRGYTSCP